MTGSNGSAAAISAKRHGDTTRSVPAAPTVMPVQLLTALPSGAQRSGYSRGSRLERPAAQPGHGVIEVCGQLLGRRTGGIWQRAQNNQVSWQEPGHALCADTPQAPSHLVTDDGSANPLTDDQAHPCGISAITRKDVEYQSGARCPPSSAHRRGEVSASVHPMCRWQHRVQAARRARPLRRREERIERPARVRMRSRKPWVLARRRLLGWNVRFDTR